MRESFHFHPTPILVNWSIFLPWVSWGNVLDRFTRRSSPPVVGAVETTQPCQGKISSEHGVARGYSSVSRVAGKEKKWAPRLRQHHSAKVEDTYLRLEYSEAKDIRIWSPEPDCEVYRPSWR